MGGCASAFQSLSRDDAEGGPPFETVDAEVFAVSGKDDGGPKILCKYDERRVGNVHGRSEYFSRRRRARFSVAGVDGTRTAPPSRKKPIAAVAPPSIDPRRSVASVTFSEVWYAGLE